MKYMTGMYELNIADSLRSVETLSDRTEKAEGFSETQKAWYYH